LNAKKTLLIIVKFLVSAGLLYVIISKTGLEKVLFALKTVNPLLFLVASLSYVVSVYFSSRRLQLLLPGGFAMRKLFSLYLIGSFFNTILPGLIGGDAIKAYYLSKDTAKASTAVASVFMDRYIGFAAMMFLGMSAYPFGFRYFRGSYIEWLLPLIAFLFVAGSFLILGLRIGSRFTFLSEFYDYFHLYKGRSDAVAKTFFLSLLVQVVGICAAYLLSLGLKLEVPLLAFFIFIPIITTLATLPVSISGLGVREASFVLLFGFIGVSPAQATALSFSWFLSTALGSLPGLIEYLRYKKNFGTPVKSR
jgi:hypothetical protein